MFSSKRSGRAGEIDLSAPGFDFLEGSAEFARLWSESEGQQTFIIEPRALGPDPFLFGMAMVDCMRHAALAYSQATNLTADVALDRIMEGLHAELSNPTDEAKPYNPEGKPN